MTHRLISRFNFDATNRLAERRTYNNGRVSSREWTMMRLRLFGCASTRKTKLKRESKTQLGLKTFFSWSTIFRRAQLACRDHAEVFASRQTW